METMNQQGAVADSGGDPTSYGLGGPQKNRIK